MIRLALGLLVLLAAVLEINALPYGAPSVVLLRRFALIASALAVGMALLGLGLGLVEPCW